MLSKYRKNFRDRFDFIVFLLFFFYGAGGNIITTSDLSLVVMSVIGFVYIVLIKREDIDRIFLTVLIYWIVINFFSWAFLGGEGFSIVKLGGSIFKMFIGFSFMKITKEKFIIWYERLVFLLALISLVFFTIQLIDNSLFAKIPFNFAIDDNFDTGHWNGIIFYYTTYHPTQNSGFGGEPGGFGYYIGLAMIFNLIIYQGKINKRFLIFILVGITTFSTNFYLTLILFAMFFVYKSTALIKAVSFAVLLPLIFIFFQLPFLGQKVVKYFDETKAFSEARIIKRTRINRTSMFVNDVRDISKYPFGRGINESKLQTNIYGEILEGTNDFSRIAVRYGVFGLIYFLVIYFRMSDKISLGMKGSFVLVLIMLMYIAANSMERDYYAMSLFWLYFLVTDNAIAKMLAHYGHHPQLAYLSENHSRIIS